MGFLESIKRGIRLIKLDGKAAVELTNDTNSTIYGWVIIAIAGLLGALVISIKTVPFDIQGFLTDSATGVVLTLLIILIYHGFAKLLGGKSKLPMYFRAQSHVDLLSWLAIFTAIELPFIGMKILNITILEWLIFLWSIIISAVVLKSVHKLSTGKSIFVIIGIPLLLLILFMILVGVLAFFGILSPERFLPPR